MAVSTISQAGLDAPITLISPTLTSPSISGTPVMGASAFNTQLFNLYTSGTSYFVEFLKRVSGANSTVGSITYNGTNTLYNTTSDARLKKNIVDAQEIFEVAPSCVSDGDTGEEVQRTWGVDTSVLVPALIKAIQEQQVLIAQLQADVAALQAK
jgi:hypothetical protein